MLKISRSLKSLERLENRPLAAVSILERSDLQEYIFNSAKAFFAELGEPLFILGKEVQPSRTVQDRIDLLAVDKRGQIVIVELKRGSDKFQLLQAISYAALVSQWSVEQLQACIASKLDELSDWLDVEPNELNRSQRVLLVAEDFDYSVLVAAEWLYEKYEVEIACARISLACDGAAEYLSCTQIFPTLELAEQALTRGRRSLSYPTEAVTSWDELLANVKNTDLIAFTRAHLAANRENRVTDRCLFFRVNGKRRLRVEIRLPHGTVYQTGRFESDLTFWKDRLSDSAIEPLSQGANLRFFLKTSQDCANFLQAVTDLQSVEWVDSLPVEEITSDLKALI